MDVRLVPAAAAVWLVAAFAVLLPARAAVVAGAVSATLAAAVLGASVPRTGSGGLRAGRSASRAGSGGPGAGRSAPRTSGASPPTAPSSAATGPAALALGCVAVLLLVTGAQVHGREAGDLRGLADGGTRARITGTVRSTPATVGGGAAGDGLVRFLVAAGSVQVDGQAGSAARPTRAAVEVLAPASAGDLAYGTEVELTARLVPARSRSDRAVVRARTAERPFVRAPPPVPLRATELLRTGLVRTSEDVPGDAGRLLPAVAVGDTRGVGDLDDAMRASGLAHLTAVSGAHFSLLGGVVLALTARCRVPRRWRWLPVALVMAGFVAVVHPGASVVRAAVMGAVGVLGLVAGRPARSVPALACAVVVLLVVDPWLARDLGFVLSVVATAGIALLALPLARRWSSRAAPGAEPEDDLAAGEPGTEPVERAGSHMRPAPSDPRPVRARPPSALAAALAVPVAAQAVCAPVVLLLSPTVPTYAVLANLAAAPAVAPATVGGLLAALLGPWWPAAATWCAQVAGAGCWWIAAVARTATRLPGGQIAWVGGAAGPVLLACASAAALVLVLRCRRGVAP